MYKNLNDLVKKKPANRFFCWAASIDMVKSYFNTGLGISQIDLRDRKGGSYLMEAETYHYTELFESVGLSCNQIQEPYLPSLEFIENQIQNQQPIILSNISYPLVNKENKHVFVISGYYKNNQKIFWVLSMDPFSPNFTYKIAWAYVELIQFNLLKNDENIDCITDFGTENNTTNYAYDQFCATKYQTVQYNIEIIQLTHLVVRQNRLMLDNFFNFKYSSSEIYNLYGTRLGFTSFTSLPDDNLIFEKVPNDESLIYLPVWQENIAKIEFIFRIMNKHKNKIELSFLGIKEIENDGLEQTVILQDNESNNQFILENEKPNYQIVTVGKENFKFYKIQIDNDIYYSPVETYNSSIQKNKYYKSNKINLILELNN